MTALEMTSLKKELSIISMCLPDSPFKNKVIEVHAKCLGELRQAYADFDMAQDRAIQAEEKVELLKQHLRSVLEICRVWEPDYASGMDRKTLVLAADAARDFMEPNA